MSDTQQLVRRFYEEIWNNQNFHAAGELLAENLLFRGSLGATTHGRFEFIDYVKFVTTGLSSYHCHINDLVSEGSRAAAKMTFSGVHTGDFLGHSPTQQPVKWDGAAFFTQKSGQLVDIWVLGDLYSLTQLLREQANKE